MQSKTEREIKKLEDLSAILKERAYFFKRAGKLARVLNDAVAKTVTGEKKRSEVIASMAKSAGISESTVHSILNGAVKCPPRERLSGFAKVLKGVSSQTLVSAATSDGCTYK